MKVPYDMQSQSEDLFWNARYGEYVGEEWR